MPNSDYGNNNRQNKQLQAVQCYTLRSAFFTVENLHQHAFFHTIGPSFQHVFFFRSTVVLFLWCEASKVRFGAARGRFDVSVRSCPIFQRSCNNVHPRIIEVFLTQYADSQVS